MKVFGQLKQAMLEVIPGAVAQKVAGLVYYRSDTKKPLIDDGDAVREIMLRHLLSTTEPILPSEGGTGKVAADLVAANVGDVLILNAAKTGYDLLPPGGITSLPNFSYYYIDTPLTVTVPDGQVMYLLNDNIVVDGTLVVDGRFEELIVDTESVGTVNQSMLTEAQYQAEKGSQWILADGRNVAGSYYEALTGLSVVPDMRGQFVRGKNNGRADGNENPDGDLALGAYQADEFASHAHSYTIGDNFNGPSYAQRAINPISSGSTNAAGGNETRPKNITINHFIKIDY